MFKLVILCNDFCFPTNTELLILKIVDNHNLSAVQKNITGFCFCTSSKFELPTVYKKRFAILANKPRYKSNHIS